MSRLWIPKDPEAEVKAKSMARLRDNNLRQIFRHISFDIIRLFVYSKKNIYIFAVVVFYWTLLQQEN